MAKANNSFDYSYSLLVLDSRERIVTGFTTSRDLAGARKVAKSALRLDERAAFVDIHHYAPTAAQLENADPVARVSLDDEE